MTLWLTLAAVTAAVLALVLLPFLRRGDGAAGRAEHDLAVYRDQLAEAERDLESGLLTADQADAIRTEVQRRILAASGAERAGRPVGRTARAAFAGAVTVLLPASAFGLYTTLGTPGMPDRPYAAVQAEREALGGDQDPAILAMVEGLAARLQQHPQDVEGWQLLGRSFRALNRLEEAAKALREAARLGSTDPETYATLGESITLAGGGTVTPEAGNAFRNALRLHAGDPRSRFYLGLESMQLGDAVQAIAIWRDLEKDSAPQAPWLPFLRERMREAAAQAAVDPAAVAPQSPVTATVRDGRHERIAPAERDTPEMIRTMVDRLSERLAQNGDDADGWVKLGRSYRVLGDLPKARDAYARAAALKPADVAIKMDYADVLLLMAGEPEQLPAEYVVVMREVLSLDPGNADAQYFIGLAELQAGRYGAARGLWGKLLAGLDPRSAEYKELKRQIDELPES
ncbi:MAG TPA: c-type cytochrome biogenesis protein CcmI [Azospirillum sp.]|nr:c-type cytochrome biogenesis protein CcmI [Azospirillum sp.]